jgi:hypothetical protein
MIVRWREERERRETEREVWREFGGFGDRGGHWPCSSQT